MTVTFKKWGKKKEMKERSRSSDREIGEWVNARQGKNFPMNRDLMTPHTIDRPSSTEER